MTAEYGQSCQFRSARIQLWDLAGLKIRDCEVSGLKDPAYALRARVTRLSVTRKGCLCGNQAFGARSSVGCW
jgi:hypothetical protein